MRIGDSRQPKAMSLDELLQVTHQLDEADLDRLLQQVVTLRVHRRASTLPATEAHMLETIRDLG